MLLNPLNIGPGWNGNYIAPDSPTTSGQTGTAAGNPASNSQIANYPQGQNPLGIVEPVGLFWQFDTPSGGSIEARSFPNGPEQPAFFVPSVLRPLAVQS